MCFHFSYLRIDLLPHFSAHPSLTTTFSTYTSWHRQNISFPAVMFNNSCSQGPKVTKDTQNMAILTALGICQQQWQKSKEER